jgi:metal-sulfur cluster biosynthetic enzyme
MNAPNPDILDALSTVIDPELGINIVELGLVYRADFTRTGIIVRFTTTSPTCPHSETLLAEVTAALRKAFPETAGIDIALTWDPPWSPGRLSEPAWRQLGGDKQGTAPPGKTILWPKRSCLRMTRH